MKAFSQFLQESSAHTPEHEKNRRDFELQDRAHTALNSALGYVVGSGPYHKSMSEHHKIVGHLFDHRGDKELAKQHHQLSQTHFTISGHQ